MGHGRDYIFLAGRYVLYFQHLNLMIVIHHFYAGYTPFDRDTQQQEMEAIIAGDYAFEPAEYWSNVSDTARSFVTECLTIDPASRPTAEQALAHKWVRCCIMCHIYYPVAKACFGIDS